MATWQGYNVNTGEIELPKYNTEGVFSEVYIAALTTALANGDTIIGPVIQANLFVQDVVAAPDDIDSGATATATFSVGYINAGTFTPAGFIADGNTSAQTGGVAHLDVPAGFGRTFSNNVTVAASITAGADTIVAGNFRLGVALTASP